MGFFRQLSSFPISFGKVFFDTLSGQKFLPARLLRKEAYNLANAKSELALICPLRVIKT